MQNTDPAHWDERRREKDDLDLALDAALAKYAAVEPRAGLEQRILTQLQAENARLPNRSWWQWSAACAIAVLLACMLALAWRSNRPAKLVVQRPSAPVERAPSATQVEATGEIQTAAAIRQIHKATRHQVRPPAVVAADGPKLDQFPSPEPLTKEELALVQYVRHFPSDAVIVASAQEEFEKEVEQEIAGRRQATSNSIEEER
jgi:hypothetical protein